MAGLAIPAATATPANAATAPALGVDVSPFTTITSWTQVQQAGASFAGDEATFAATAESTYASDAEAAVQAGLYVMPYAFVFPYNPSANGTVAEQAQAVVNVVNSVPSTAYEFNGHNMRLPLVVDIEADPYYQTEGTTPCYGLTPSALVSWLQTFVADVSSISKTPIIYTTANFWTTCTGNNKTAFSADPLWLASYGISNPALPTGWNNYTFWQYTDSGPINGISGTTDLDYLGPVLQVSQAAQPIGPVQLRTLTSLTGQSDSYTVPSSGTGSLPPGLTMSSSGQISGTPSAIGQYNVTVTPSAGAVPAAMSFTWDVHGTLAVNSPGNRTTTAGSPVVLRVTAVDQDGSSYPPSFSASGLPPGLTISSSGVITGWPYKPGTYTVKVSASDGLYASGSASFTWTIAAAGNGGLTGYIKQVGGSAKCLDDPGSKTANGTLIDVWTCEAGHPNESWTRVQDGTIRVLGKCLDVVGESKSNGAKLQLWTCNSGDGAQQWESGTGGQLINPQSGKCIYLPGTSPANGAQLQLNSCANVANEHWSRSAAKILSGEPSGCLGISGSTVELVGCPSSAAQHWLAQADGTLRVSGGCLTETGTTAGAGLVIGSCTGAAATKWKLTAAGPIAVELASAASGLCVTTPVVANGAKLVIEPCAATPAATWQVL